MRRVAGYMFGLVRQRAPKSADEARRGKKRGFVNRHLMISAVLAILLVAPTAVRADDRADIRRLEERLVVAFKAKDLDAIMSAYAPDEKLFVFDAIPPRQYVGAAAWRDNNAGFLANYPGPIDVDAKDLVITTDGKLGFAHYVFHMTGTSKAGTHDEYNFRITDCLEKRKGKWVIVHEHLSFPVDLTTGKADVLAKP